MLTGNEEGMSVIRTISSLAEQEVEIRVSGDPARVSGRVGMHMAS